MGIDRLPFRIVHQVIQKLITRDPIERLEIGQLKGAGYQVLCWRLFSLQYLRRGGT